MKKITIEIKGLSFSYDEKKILDDVSLNIEEGEYVSVIGPNGAGKSTLLKCINRINKKAEGKIFLFGKELDEYSQKELGSMIGYVAQNRDQTFPYTVFEFVQMGRYPYLNPWSRVSEKDLKIVEEVMALTGILDFSGRQVSELSGGERQKVYIAAALAQQPRILLLDEPTAHLDPKYHMEIQKTIRQICSQLKLTILHVTHDLNHMFFWSQKVLAIKNGRIIKQGLPSDILTAPHLREIFDTDFILVPYPDSTQKMILPKI